MPATRADSSRRPLGVNKKFTFLLKLDGSPGVPEAPWRASWATKAGN